jgi:hypothetical protein
MPSAVTLAAAQLFLNKTANPAETELQSFIDRAEAILTVRIGPLAATTVTDEWHAGGSSTLVLRKFPVISLTSAAYFDGTALTIGDLTVDGDTGIVYWGYNTAGYFPDYGPRSVKVTYSAGRASLPADLQEAVLELTKHLWESQRGGGRSFNTSADSTLEPVPTSFLLPYRVQSLIEPYLIPAVA